MKTAVLSLSFALALALPAAAQAPAEQKTAGAPVANPAVTGLSAPWTRVKDILVRAAEKMPEEHFSFRPAPEVRTFGQLVAHVADSQYFFCGTILGEKPAPRDVEKTKTSKADLVAALKESFGYCDAVFRKSDADLSAPMTLFGSATTRFAPAGILIGHDFEHYGNLVTYMRMKGIVPPSSEKPPEPKK